MPRRKSPDPDLLASVLELVRMGCSAAQVQETLGVPRSTVTRWARAAEAFGPADGATKTGDVAAAVAALGSNWTILGAAKLAGVPPDSVRTWLRARIDRWLASQGLPAESVKIDLHLSGMRA